MVLETLGNWWKEFTSQLGRPQTNSDRPIKQSQLHVTTDLNALSDVLQWFENFKLAPLSCDVWWQCQTALAEGFTNAVRHAHKHLPQNTPIDLEVTIFVQSLEMRIWDRGQPFDLDAYLEEISKKPIDPWKEGGMGLLLIKQLTDELHYTRTSNEGNCLVMKKRLSPGNGLSG